MNTDAFLSLALRNPVNGAIADELLHLALPDAWIVSGCLVQTAWNALTNRAVDYGIADYDVFYFDPTSPGRPRTRRSARCGIASRISASRSSCATRRASISGTLKSIACPTRRCDAQPRESTAS